MIEGTGAGFEVKMDGERGFFTDGGGIRHGNKIGSAYSHRKKGDAREKEK